MKRAIISISDVVDINRKLKDGGIEATLHLSDACGAQSGRIEVAPSADAETLARARTIVVDHLASKGIDLQFTDDGGSFWVSR